MFGKKSSNPNCGLVSDGFDRYFWMGSYQPALRKRRPSQDVRLMNPSTEPEPDTISTASFWRNWSSGKISHVILMPVSCSNSGIAGRMISLVQSWLLTRKRSCLPLYRFQSKPACAPAGAGSDTAHPIMVAHVSAIPPSTTLRVHVAMRFLPMRSATEFWSGLMAHGPGSEQAYASRRLGATRRTPAHGWRKLPASVFG